MRAALLYIIFLIPSFSQAEVFQDWEVEAGLEFPLQIGAKAIGNFDDDVYLSLGLGYAMEFLMASNNAVLGGLGVVGEKTGDVIESGLSDSLVLEGRVGWNLHNYDGLYVEGGVTLFNGGSGSTDLDTLEEAFGQEYHSSPLILSTSSQFSVESNFIGITGHVGYRWQVSDESLINLDVGLVKPISSSNNLVTDQVRSTTSDNSDANEVAVALESEVESELDDIFLSEIFIPTFSVWWAFSF